MRTLTPGVMSCVPATTILSYLEAGDEELMKLHRQGVLVIPEPQEPERDLEFF
jgi:hypothetical protein